MTTRHTPEHRELLEALFTGEGDPRQAIHGSPLAGCAECLEELDDLMCLDDRLAAAGRDERSSIADAEAVDDAPEHLVDAVLRPLIEGERDAAPAAAPERGPRPFWTRTRTGWLAAAAGIAAVLLLFTLGGGPDEPPAPPADPLLGTERVEPLAPLDTSGDWATFSWRAELPPNGWYVVRVYDPAAPGVTLATSPRITTERWSPSATETASWPPAIEWEVEVFDASGMQAALSRRASARR